MTDQELIDLLCLTLVPGVGPLTSQVLLEHFGSAGKVLDSSVSRLKEVPGIGPKLALKIARARDDQDAAGELELCRQGGIRLLPQTHPDFPAPLLRIPDPPPLLFIRGAFAPSDALAIAVVGSRKCTPYGVRTAERLAAGLARAGLTVVSGLARGIDAAAHQAALRGGGRTLAILANGLQRVYPPEHEDLARQIAQSGAVVSEMPPRRPPMAELFSQRNRIISGLCLGVVVVEAAPRSGSLSTARHALDQNREVFAVPGPVDSLASRGCHRLIRDGAKLVETVDDILEELGPLARAVTVRPAPETQPDSVASRPELPGITLNDRERALLEQVGDRPVSVDELAAAARLGVQEVLSTLPVLELRRLVKRLPGNCFVRS